MSMQEVTERVHSLGHAWEEYKRLNDARLAEIEKKGAADPLYTESLGKIGDAIDQYKSRLDRSEVVRHRPELEIKSAYMAASGHDSEYAKAFRSYLRKGMDAGLEALSHKSLSVGSDADGGYLVSTAMSERIVKTVFESSPMRQIASAETISTDTLDLIVDRDEAAAGWTSETGSVSDTTTPQVGKKSIPVHELYAQPKATQKLVDDSAVDIETWIVEKVAEIFARKENTAFIGGDGVGKPRGILTYAAGASWGQIQQVASGSSGSFDADDVIELFYSLKDEHARQATFLMNRSVIKAVRLLKDTGSGSDQYLWQPGLAAGAPDTLMGVPVMAAADMPVAAADSLSIAVGDFKAAYQIVDRIGIRTLRDPFTDKPFVKFYTTKRVGGDVVNFDAIKLLKLGA